MKKEAGVTLIELIITLAVGAIVLGIAVPNFTSMAKSNRLTAQVNLFVTAMNYARAEAINRSAPIAVTANNDNWAEGWQVLQGGDVLRASPALHGSLAFTVDNGTTTFTYQPNGRVVGLGDVLTMCDDRTGEQGRQITVSPTGRVAVVTFACN
jgi:prepilin-type N-terminal cleavage/methylation domain-containing protein